MITGNFISIYVPSEIVVGENVEVTIDFYAHNPDGSWTDPWKTFLIADSPGLSLRRELDAAREWGQKGGRKKTYNLGKMPNKKISISLSIFAHNDASYDWSWNEYMVWLDGYPVKITHIDSAYIFVSPMEAPTDEQHFVGKITSVTRAPKADMFNVVLLVSWTASADWINYLGWETKVTISGIGVTSDRQNHYGTDGSRTNQSFELGAWSPGTYTAIIRLEAKGMIGQWVILDEITKTVAIEGIEPSPPGEEEEKKFPWATVLIGGGALIAIAGLASASKKV